MGKLLTETFRTVIAAVLRECKMTQNDSNEKQLPFPFLFSTDRILFLLSISDNILKYS